MSDPTHNASPQVGVVANPDPALDVAHEHQHQHLHHSAAAAQHLDKGTAYTTGTTEEPQTVPTADLRGHGVLVGQNEKYQVETKAIHEAENEAEKENERENGSSAQEGSSDEREDGQRHVLSRLYSKYKPLVHLFIWLFFTGWWIASLVLHRHDMNWIIPFLLYLAITVRLITFYIPITVVTRPVAWVWQNTAVRVAQMLPEKSKTPLAALVVIAVFLVGAFASPESSDNTRANRAVSLFGLLVFVFVLWLTSRNRKAIKWHTVLVGLLTQFIIALFVLKTGAGYDIFSFISGLAEDLLTFANDGTAFLTNASVPKLGWFLVSVIPAIVFFVGFVQLLYYWGLLQWATKKFATFFFWSMRVSGAEAVVAAASPFIGQGESAMLIKPFVAHLTRAELHQVMTSGFATISGSVLVAYIGLGINPQALVSSCVMSIPASLAISKLRYPEEEETLTAGRVVIPDDDEHRAANSLHAFANGAWLGLKIGGMIVATLLCILALLGLVNALLGWWGKHINITEPQLTVQLIVGYICYPIAFLLGVPRNGDLLLVGQLIGTKLIANEFVAYSELQNSTGPYVDLSPRSRLIATYALCGFANIGSLGTQIGVLSQIAPGRAGDVSRLALSSLISGALSTLTSASIAGLLVTDQSAYTKLTAST